MSDYTIVKHHILNYDRSDFEDLCIYVTEKNNGIYEETEEIITDYIDCKININKCMELLGV